MLRVSDGKRNNDNQCWRDTRLSPHLFAFQRVTSHRLYAIPLDVSRTRNGQIHQSADAPGRRLSSASSYGSLDVWWHHITSDDLHSCGLTCEHISKKNLAIIWALPCTRCQNSLLRLFMRFRATGVNHIDSEYAPREKHMSQLSQRTRYNPKGSLKH